MKKFIALISFILSFSLLAGTSGTIFLSGTISSLNDISIAPYAKATTLNIIAGENLTQVADVTETSRSLTGYKIQLSSQNGGKLIHSTLSTQSIAYKLSYNSAASFTPSTIAQTVKTISSLTQKTTSINPLKITIQATPNALEGTYQDTVTISIVAN